MTTHGPDFTNVGTAPGITADDPWRQSLDDSARQLQAASTVDEVLGLIQRSISRLPGIGKGAIFLVRGKCEPDLVATLDGPESADLVAPAIELTGMARRALREGGPVQQRGVSAGSIWAVPMRSGHEIVGAVSAVGEMRSLPDFLAHAGLALARETARAAQSHVVRRAEARALDLDRGLEILDTIVRDGTTDPLLRTIVGAIASTSGLAGASLWVLRAEDGAYVEVASSGNCADEGSRTLLPHSARRASGLRSWKSDLPRWGDWSWIAANTIARPRPGAGDTLILTFDGPSGLAPVGFVLVSVEQPLEDPNSMGHLARWTTLARLALESRSNHRESVRHFEDLQQEKEALSELHRLKSQFIAAVSHELRTPLTSITAYAETLRTPEVTTSDDTREKFLRVIYEESRRLTRIVDDILDLATMDSGRVRIACGHVDLVQIISDAFDIIRPLADERGIHVSREFLEPAPIYADPDLLKQLTVNLLENAVKFSPEGGSVTVAIERDATAIRMVVADDGPGIPADQLDSIFERFYQVDGSNARQHGGSGLGLAICKSIATWHDGRVWAESELGEGARFVVSLPRDRATSRSRAEKPVLADENPEGHRLLELMIEMVSEVMCSESVSLMLLDEDHEHLLVQAALGLPDEAIREVRVAVGDRISGVVAESGETLLIPDLDKDERFSAAGRYRTKSLLSVPIKMDEATIGVINVTNKTTGEPFGDHDRLLMEMLAERVARVLRRLAELGDSRGAVERIEAAIRGVIDVRRHHYSSGEDFVKLVLDVCRSMGIDRVTTAKIHYASILRDIGMVRLPEGVYRKPVQLTSEDRELIEQHPEEGARVLQPIEFLPDVFDIILSHHEGPDGSGYPRGLTDRGIPQGAKILAVVDAFHSMRAGRPHRPSLGVEQAVEELRRVSGTQFDSEIVGALVQVLEERGELVPTASDKD